MERWWFAVRRLLTSQVFLGVILRLPDPIV